MKLPLEIAMNALQEIIDTEKSSNVGWNAAMNMASIARRALEDIEKHIEVTVEKSIDVDFDHQEHGMEGL